MIEFCICTDRDHPWDTEQWSDETYDYGADPLAYTTIEDVDRAAKEVAERFAENAGYFAWDGISTQRESLG